MASARGKKDERQDAKAPGEDDFGDMTASEHKQITAKNAKNTKDAER